MEIAGNCRKTWPIRRNATRPRPRAAEARGTMPTRQRPTHAEALSEPRAAGTPDIAAPFSILLFIARLRRLRCGRGLPRLGKPITAKNACAT